MNSQFRRSTKHAWRIAGIAAALAILSLPGPGQAALTSIAPSPMASSTSGTVKPNIMFSLDDSGSMAWTHNPDDAEAFEGKFGYASSQCNGAYYDPSITYKVPKNADGTDFAAASFTNAWTNGYNTGAGTVNLSTSFYTYDNTTGNGNGNDPNPQPAYYFRYTGSQTFKDYLDTSSTFYTECIADDVATATISVGAGGSSTSVTSIKVNGVEIMTGASTASTTSNTVATNIKNKIGLAGYTATSSGSTVTITGPVGAASFVPVITQTGSKPITPSAFVTGPFVKVVVSATSGPGSTDERQNFANWFSYYRTRILTMKTGAGRAFVGIGTTYRVGFTTIHNTSTSTSNTFLPIADFTTTQKASWYSTFYARIPGSGTPLREQLAFVGRMYAGKNGADPVQYSCQQNFVILSTDGYWNASSNNGYKIDGSTSVGNQDNNSTNTPRPMYDGGLSGASNTLADVAAYYYNTDLRTGSAAACATGVAGADVCQNNVPISGIDNAPWQHMTTFTLGLGVNGTLKFADNYLTGGSADYNAIVGGSKDWPVPVGDTPTAVDDLWHAAVNGHGQYFSARNPDLLVSGLTTALASVAAREAAGAAAATSNLEPVAGDNFAYVANYRTVKWDGDVEARTIDLTTGAISTTAVWSAQVQLDASVSAASDTRTIYTYSSVASNKLRSFAPGSFSAAEKLAWFTPSAAPVLSQYAGLAPADQLAATPDTIINYLRGQKGFEQTVGNTNLLYRVREHVLGDVIDGKPVFIKLPPFKYVENNYQTFVSSTTVQNRAGMVYVAANDGMLHAFDGNTGSETWAYVPSFVLPNMKQLADATYSNNHQYYVDGSPIVSDIFNGTQWKTILVGGLNGGGKGYYALDVTDPAAPKALWEFSDVNLGFSFGNPLIGKLQNGTWVVMFTSGLNNTNDGQGRLFVVNADTGALLFTVNNNTGTAASPSGLSKISGWVDDSLNDATVLRVYGGDMQGNLWRFDINNIYPPSGKDAVLLAQFQISGTPQPITTKPELGLVGGTRPVIFIGTGRYLGIPDLTDTSQQSFYAIRDDLLGTGIGDARTETACPLVQQTITALTITSRTTSSLPVDFSTKCGWYVDFNPGNATPGERVNVDPKLQLGVIAIATNVPAQSICNVGGTSWLYFLDFSTGSFVTTTGGLAGQQVGNSLIVGLSSIDVAGKSDTNVTTSDDKHPTFANPTNPNTLNIGKRVSWRELLN